MKMICGIDLDKNEARIVVLGPDLQLIATDVTRIGIADPKDQAQVGAFRDEIQKFFDEQAITHVAIRERLSKGRMKGGTITFKLEGLIQSCRQRVTLISPASIRRALTAVSIDFAELPIAKYQHEAYGAAYCAMTASG